MKERIVYKSDTFVDFKGISHNVIIAAVSQVLDEPINVSNMPIQKVLCIGMAFQNPDDEYDEELGQKVAYCNAVSKKNPFKLYASFPGMINTKVVDSLIEQELTYFKNNPGSHIRGYNCAKINYIKRVEKEKRFNELIASLNDDEANFVNSFKSLDKDKKTQILSCLNEC